MMYWNKIQAAFLLLIASVTIASSWHSTGQEAQSARARLARMEEALGGTAALSDLTSLSVAASGSGPGGAFETEIDSFRYDYRDIQLNAVLALDFVEPPVLRQR